MAATTSAPHIWLDEEKRAWIDDTNVKVVEVALDHVAYGWSAEEMHSHHPHLSLAQIYSALAYYYDHQAEIDRRNAEDDAFVEAFKRDNPTKLQERLRSLRNA